MEGVRIGILGINIATSLLTVVSNVVVFSVVTFHKELRTRSNFLICYLAVNDLAVGIILQPLFTAYLLVDRSRDCFTADALYTLTAVTCGSSCFTLVLISYDRYLHLTKLQRYHDYMPERKLCLLLILCWVVPIFECTFLINADTRSVFFVVVVTNTVCDAIALWLCYRKIYAFIREKSKVIPAKGMPSKTENTDLALFVKTTKLAKSFAVLVGCFIVCWLPLKINLLYFTVISTSGVPFEIIPPYIDALHCFAITIGLCNSFLNPMMYFWKNRELRKKAKALLRSTCCES